MDKQQPSDPSKGGEECDPWKLKIHRISIYCYDRVEKSSFTVICGQKVLVNRAVLEMFCQDL